jgi:serine/threonine protein kinase
MGAVYEAVRSDINRTVAIKVLHPQFAEKPEFKIRFTNEARIANVVDHPGLLQIADYGQLPDGSAYLVMEYLRGETLGTRIKRSGGILSPSEAVRLAHLVADSLEAAHSKGVIHRDLKPDNVMIVPDRNVSGGERTKLLDFGIAKLADDTEAAQVQTQTGMIMGTPAYMSPEQCRGLKDIDSRTDVYALGVMLYVMCSGKAPFSGTQVAVISGHLVEQPPMLDSIAPSVSPRLAALAFRMLSKEKASRPSMREVVAELEEMIEYRPSAKHVSLPEKFASDSATVPLPTDRLITLPAAIPSTQVRSEPPLPFPWWKHRLTVVGVALISVALLASLTWRVAAPRSGETPIRPSTAKPAFVQWSIDSEPHGAKVIRELDGKQLCTTPCNREQPIGTDAIEVQVHLDGYSDVVLQLATHVNEQRRLTLEKLKLAAQVPSPGSPGPAAKNQLSVTKKSKSGLGSPIVKGATHEVPKPED